VLKACVKQAHLLFWFLISSRFFTGRR